MKKNLPLNVLWLVFLAFLFLAGCSQEDSPQEPDTHFNYYGRIDFEQEASPVLIWQGSRVEMLLEKAEWVELNFSRKAGQVYFDVLVNGDAQFLAAQQGANRIALPESSTPIKLALVKRNEASSGTIAFDGITLPKGGNSLALPKSSASLKFLFFGDSITAGACNEDGEEDQWEDMRTHNALKSYAALTAEHFLAEYQNISVSGMGISMGYTSGTFPDTWNKLYPHGDRALETFDDFQPDFVFINLGENDDSWSQSRGVQFPIDYDDRYIAMVKAMRQAFPDAHFVILRGGMYGGKKSERLREPWKKVVASLKQTDNNLSSFVFSHWSRLHPRVADHEQMAKELVAWLERKIY